MNMSKLIFEVQKIVFIVNGTADKAQHALISFKDAFAQRTCVRFSLDGSRLSEADTPTATSHSLFQPIVSLGCLKSENNDDC